METSTSGPAQLTTDALPIVEDDQQLYDWGIEHRLEQYYNVTDCNNASATPPPRPPSVSNATPPTANFTVATPTSPYNNNESKYILPEGVGGPISLQTTPTSATPVPISGIAISATPPPTGTTNKLPACLPLAPVPPTQLGTAPAATPTHLAKVVKIETKPVYSHLTPPPAHAHSRSLPPLRPNGPPGRRPNVPHIDMDANEILKVERKRARNRVAASKCRMRKLERIAVLDQQANQLRADNEQLAKMADKLRSQVYSLKQELRWHVNNGCKVARADILDNSAAFEVADKGTSCDEYFDSFYTNQPPSGTGSANQDTHGQSDIRLPVNHGENVLASPDSTTMLKKEPIDQGMS